MELFHPNFYSQHRSLFRPMELATVLVLIRSIQVLFIMFSHVGPWFGLVCHVLLCFGPVHVPIFWSLIFHTWNFIFKYHICNIMVDPVCVGTDMFDTVCVLQICLFLSVPVRTCLILSVYNRHVWSCLFQYRHVWSSLCTTYMFDPVWATAQECLIQSVPVKTCFILTVAVKICLILFVSVQTCLILSVPLQTCLIMWQWDWPHQSGAPGQ